MEISIDIGLATAIGALISLPVKATVDAIRLYVDMPKWGTLALVFLFGLLYAGLALLMSNQGVTSASVAQALWAAVQASLMAIGATRLQDLRSSP